MKNLFASLLLLLLMLGVAWAYNSWDWFQEHPQERGGFQPQEKVGDESLALLDQGRISGSTYRNDALGFSYEFPAGWHAVDNATQEKVMDAASRDFYGVPDPPDEHETAALCMRVLLWTTKYVQAGIDSRPRAIVVAVVPDCYPGLSVPVKDEERRYVREAIDALSATFAGSILLGDDDQKIRNFKRQSRDFLQASTVRKVNIRTESKYPRPMRSEVIVTKAKSYWLVWLLVSDTHSELQKLEKLKVRFD